MRNGDPGGAHGTYLTFSGNNLNTTVLVGLFLNTFAYLDWSLRSETSLEAPWFGCGNWHESQSAYSFGHAPT